MQFCLKKRKRLERPFSRRVGMRSTERKTVAAVNETASHQHNFRRKRGLGGCKYDIWCANLLDDAMSFRWDEG